MADQGQCVATDSSGPEAAAAAEEPAAPPEVLGTRTRSGRRVRTPALLLADSQAPSPARRARKPALALLKEGSAEEKEEEMVVVVEEEEGRAVAAVRLGNGCNGAEVETAPGCPDQTPREKALFVAGAKQTPAVPLGKPKSGRVWKDRNKQRFSALVRDKPLKTSWGKKMEAKQEKQMVKKFSLQLKEDKAKVKEIRNTSKIKRMKKKQLRKVEKRDTLALLQKSQSGKAKGQRSSKEAKVDN
ncbi:Coiled-coil domain-containing protein 86 [Merluccius polli]|uniref:Coiled-coil domain-containing protein 86 n=1 Tax=Merluccius polli TaxID=89951 RepID=A0AA47NXD5_MERPO|nr:Coiled-coil domain-containing protein 86 [Merluccius polli]